MKFKEFLTESSNQAGYYSIHSIGADLDTLNKLLAAEKDKGKCQNIEIIHDKDSMLAWNYLVSQNYEELKEFVDSIKANISINDSIYYTANKENPQHDFSNFPRHIRTDLIFNGCTFTSLKGIDKHFTEINGAIYIDGLTVKSHILGVLKIKGVEKLNFVGRQFKKQFGHDLEQIINKYLPEGDILECQDELIDAGFSEYAQL